MQMRQGAESLAAELAGIGPRTVNTAQWLGHAAFQAADERTRTMCAEVLQDEVVRRAIHGGER